MITMDASIRTKITNDIRVVNQYSKTLMVMSYGISVACGVFTALLTRVDLLALSAIFASIGCGFLCIAYMNRTVENMFNCWKLGWLKE